jgi:phosphoribosylamine-glycine ligase
LATQDILCILDVCCLISHWASHLQAKLLEHNVRFGDPECQCLMMRLESDLLQLLLEAASGRLGRPGSLQPLWSKDAALCVVMATKGYPGAYAKNTPIAGVESVASAKVRYKSVRWEASGIFNMRAKAPTKC